LFLTAVFSIAALTSCSQLKSAAPLPALASTETNALNSLGNYAQLYEFKSGRDGRAPETSLLATGGLLYGTTDIGGDGSIHCGDDGCGTIFSFNRFSGAEKVLHRFKGRQDGYRPEAPLIVVDGKLYGTTTEGGSTCAADGCGTIFSFDLSSGVEEIVHRFRDNKDGWTPNGLVALNGQLYGTTTYGGGAGCIYNQGCGILFAFDPSSDTERILYRFKGGKDGENPVSRLITLNGKLYGTTSLGGGTCSSYGCGTIFAFNPASGVEAVLYRFKGGRDGQLPRAGLLAVNGTLYGTTYESGGCYDYAICGTLFAYDLSSGDEKAVHRFKGGRDGTGPAADLTAINGVVYGATGGGGENPGCKSCGTIFSFDPSTGVESIRYRFKNTLGSGPNGLIPVNGTLYGTTLFGDGYECGVYGGGCGTIFKFAP
jgi:uncharacterized repeat protein (TIGR03803 family)